jgi:ParB family transcriptional regulator, chromosome partitioning protein
MVKVRGLGRGLDALLGSEGDAATRDALAMLAVDALEPGRFQPRTRMDQDALAELAESIRSQGVMQPILVRPLAEGRYEIVAGERRWRAARMAGLERVPALVREVPDSHALAMALIENIQREDLNPLEQAAGMKRLIDEFGMTHAQAAEALGRSRTGITNTLRLLELAAPVQELLRAGKLDMGHARALLALPALRQIELAREAAAKQLSVRQVESRVNVLLTRRGPRASKRVDRDIARLEEEVSQRLGTRVEINAGKGGAGKLVLHYSSHDHLDTLLGKLGRGG